MKEQAVSTRWKPGESGNPAGRPTGSRNKLSEAVLQDIAEDWAAGGAEAIARVRVTDPSTYFRVVASILPKDLLLSVVDNTTVGGLTADDRASLRRLLDVIQLANIAGEPGEVFERIEQFLRAENAKQIDG